MATYLDGLKEYYNTYTIPHKSKSEEFYFGEDNPLKTRLIANISHMREIAESVKTKKRNALPRDIVPELKLATEELKETIMEEFNVEGVAIGWQNVTNAACFVQCSNGDIFGKEKPAKDLRVRLDDIVTNDNNGFHYRNKKGIYYCVILGYNIFATDELFTVEEATAVLLHELGHAMQHLVSSLNESIATAQFEALYQVYEPNISALSPEDRRYVETFMKKYRAAIRTNDKATLNKLGEEYLDALSSKDSKGYSEYTDEYISDYASKYAPDWSKDTAKADKNRIEKEGKFSIGKFIKSIFKGVVSIAFCWFLIPSMIIMRNKLKNKANDEHVYKVFEEAADNFCQIYGMGEYQATALRKLEKFSDSYTRGSLRLFERIPMLDLVQSFQELSADRNNCLCGYPTYKQRAINLYKSAEFELKNNKDLSEESKKELERQIESYKRIYEDYVNNEQSKGWFYKLISGANRCSLEEAAKKDKFVEEQVLIPLQEKADPNFKPIED